MRAPIYRNRMGRMSLISEAKEIKEHVNRFDRS